MGRALFNFFVGFYAGACMTLVFIVAVLAIVDKAFEINVIKLF